MDDSFRIGEVAERSRVSIDTIRYYERRDLLPKAPRTTGGYRLFTSEAVERVLFIKQAQELGFSLDEITTLLSTSGPTECRGVRDLLDAKLTELNARLKSMNEFHDKLTRYLAECEEELKKHPDSAECPVVDEIAHSSDDNQA
ncbi:MAG: heavy metal-responsive transcriptional regulator [Acidobacteria bacterium]|nr:heavy metal-responsive transcriptional regulator [Acidobacteriota bacterium]